MAPPYVSIPVSVLCIVDCNKYLSNLDLFLTHHHLSAPCSLFHLVPLGVLFAQVVNGLCAFPFFLQLVDRFHCSWSALPLTLNIWYELGAGSFSFFNAQVTELWAVTSMRPDGKHHIISSLSSPAWALSWMGLWVGLIGKEVKCALCVWEEKWNGSLVIKRMVIMCSRNSTLFLLLAPESDCIFLLPCG